MALSVAVHIGVAYALWNSVDSKNTLNTGSLAAPVSLNFATVQRAAVDSVEAQPEPEVKKEIVQKEPEPVVEPVLEKAPLKPVPHKTPEPVAKPVPKVEPDPQPQPPKPVETKENTQPDQKSQSELTASAILEPQALGVSDIPVMTEPSFLSPPKPPKYPRQARRRNQQGTVLVEALVDENGETLDVEIYESSGFPLLDRAAVKAVTGWELQPKIVGGKAVLSKVQVPVRFSLRNSI